MCPTRASSAPMVADPLWVATLLTFLTLARGEPSQKKAPPNPLRISTSITRIREGDGYAL